MATISKVSRSGGTVYKARVRKQGQGQISKTFTYRADAVRWAKATEGDIERTQAGLINEAQRHTLGEAIQRYRDEMLPSLRPETARKYAHHLDHWDIKLGALRLSELTAQRIVEVRDELTGSPATRNRYTATLASVLTACVRRWYWMTTSPMQQVEKPTEDNKRKRFLSKQELDRLLKACRKSESPDLYLAVLLSITTGARQGELLGITWGALDLKRNVLSLRVDTETENKGGIRTLPIAPQAIPMLRARKATAIRALRKSHRHGHGRIDPLLVFPGKANPARPIRLRRAWVTALERAGIENFHWHDLRHSAASFLAAGGASLLEIGAVLGHKSANTTQRYAHLVEDHTHDLVRGMADKILGGA
jgi:integrase